MPDTLARFDHQKWLEIARVAARRLQEDQLLRVASSLSYTTLLSLVPLMGISFAIFSAFPVFDGVQGQIQSFVFQNFVPAAGDIVQDTLSQFTENTGRMTTVGVVGLAVTSMMLLSNIETALNIIFRVKEKRAIVPRFLMFWALLTLGPLMLGASLSLSTYFFALTSWTGVDQHTFIFDLITSWLPDLIVMVALFLIYIVVPNRAINWRWALVGAVVAGLLFAILKKLFGLYVSNLVSYQAIYGALAAIPLFLIWMYLTWSVILFGGLVTATMQDWGKPGFGKQDRIVPAERLSSALAMVKTLADAHQKGGKVKQDKLAREYGARLVKETLAAFEKHDLVMQDGKANWVLSKSLETTTLADLHDMLDLSYGERAFDVGKDAVQQAEAARRELMGISLAKAIVSSVE